MIIIQRTEEQDREFAVEIAKRVVDSYHPKATGEAWHRITSDAVKAKFPELKQTTLRSWCRTGKIGRKGIDGHYYVQLKSLERFVFGI